MSVALVRGLGGGSSYLASGDELEGPQGGAEVGDVGLEVGDGTSNAGLDLRGVLAAGLSAKFQFSGLAERKRTGKASSPQS